MKLRQIYEPASRREAKDFFAVFSSFEKGGSSFEAVRFVFPRLHYVSLSLASGNIEGLGETKLIVSLGAGHYVQYFIRT